MHIHGYPVALGVLAFASGAALWHRGWMHRLAMGFFAAGAALLALGVVQWQDALAGLTGTGPGAVVLLIVAIFTAVGFWYEMTHKRRDRRGAAHILAMVSGTAVVMLIGNSARLLREASRSPGKTATALAQSVRGIRSGQAGHAMSSHQSLVILAAACGVAVFLAVAGGRHERRSGSPARRPLAITSGTASPAAPHAQFPVPANRKGR